MRGKRRKNGISDSGTYSGVTGDHTVSIEEALLESFYILLELYKNQPITPELVEEYFSPETLQQLRTAITQAKSTISSLETWEECNELLQDLAVNYRKEGLYEKFLTPVITQAKYYSQIFGRQGIHVGEDMDATKGKMRQDSFGIGGDSSGMHLHRMNCCFVISSETKCFRI